MIETDDPATATALLEERGAVCLPQLHDPARIERVAVALHDYVAGELLTSGGHYYSVGDRRIMIPVPLRTPFVDEELLDPEPLRQLLSPLLGDDYIVQSYGAVLAMPGAAPQQLHRDYSLLYNPAIGVNLPPYAFTVVVPLVPITADNGSTALVLDSHRLGDGETYAPYPPLGGCYLWDYRLFHGGLRNNSKTTRPILYLVYARPWFVDPENFQTVPPLREPDEELPPRAARLLRRARQRRVVSA